MTGWKDYPDISKRLAAKLLEISYYKNSVGWPPAGDSDWGSPEKLLKFANCLKGSELRRWPGITSKDVRAIRSAIAMMEMRERISNLEEAPSRAIKAATDGVRRYVEKLKEEAKPTA